MKAPGAVAGASAATPAALQVLEDSSYLSRNASMFFP